MIKRISDIVLAFFGLIFLSPLFLLVGLWIKFYDDGPIIFAQQRVGQSGRLFSMKKFRSMVVAQEAGGALTVGKDNRITPPGQIIRRYKMDELPQLWNVLKGEMTLVGPRPEIAKFVDLYSPAQRRVLELKPGITDPASFAFFDESELLSRVADPERFYRDQLMGEKIRINLDYAERAGFVTDLVLILATVGRACGVRFDLFGWLKIELPNIEAPKS